MGVQVCIRGCGTCIVNNSHKSNTPSKGINVSFFLSLLLSFSHTDSSFKFHLTVNKQMNTSTKENQVAYEHMTRKQLQALAKQVKVTHTIKTNSIPAWSKSQPEE